MSHRPSAPARKSPIDRLFSPVDIASLVFFRVAFGAVMVWEVWRYFSAGWIARYWIDPPYNFGYFGLEWVKPLPGPGLYVLFAILGVLGFNIMAGFQYRLSALLFFPAFTYTFLLEEARYLNHLYLVGLISFLMIFLPAHHAFSVDARRNGALQSRTVPSWTIWLLRFQIGVVYFYGGLAKLNADWLAGVPLDQWLAARSHYPVIGPLLKETAVVYFFSWGGLLLDLLVVPALLWTRTRVPAFIAMTLFHLLNAWIFRIGIFPWFMVAATTVFLPPGWPRRWLGRRTVVSAGAERSRRPEAPPVGGRRAVLAFLGAWAVFQLLFPLRHFLYPGDVNWTEEGHRFSWHMKLRDKEGEISFTLTDPVTRVASPVDPGHILPEWQVRRMAGRPDMILQFSHYLRDLEVASGSRPPEVRVHALCRLNGRPPRFLIDPSVDLARETRSLRPASWIVPLSETLAAGD